MKNTGNRTPGWYRQRIAWLEEFATPGRVESLRRTLSERTRYMAICMENTFHPQNASALVRHCDAFGIQDIYTIEETCRFKPNVNIVRGTDKWVSFHRSRSTGEAVAKMKEAGYRIIATTPHQGDFTPETFDVGQGPFAVVFGTEHEGISHEIKESADQFLRIPMWGFVESLNVSASAAIILYMLSSAVRSSGIDYHLSEQESLPILYDWLRESIRESGKILLRNFQEI